MLQRSDGQLDIENTQTWQKGNWDDNYDLDKGGCRTTAQSDWGVEAKCTTGTCRKETLYYTALFVGEDYCYGDGSNTIPKPSQPFTFGWRRCCWVGLTDDNGNHVRESDARADGDMVQQMAVYDVDNNSPSFKLPPVWKIMTGCPDQQIDLAPADIDGDRVRCRWANVTEAGAAVHDATLWPSLTLNATTCTVKYDGTKDQSNFGVKPIALMMEDFDANGLVRSSVPVQFLAQVWTPNMSTRSIGAYPNYYPDWFNGDNHHDDNHHHAKVPVRGRRSVADYCTAVPTVDAPTAVDNNIDSSSAYVSFTLSAKATKNGSITAFSYQGPSGLSCDKVNSNGRTTCTWAMSVAQQQTESHTFCFDATDNFGLVSPRKCVTISGHETQFISKIIDMANTVLDGSGASGFNATDGEDYGCAGRGLYDPFASTLGASVDAQGEQVDTAFYIWKKCVQCVLGDDTTIPAYHYDQATDSCAKTHTGPNRAVCECDRALVNFLYDKSPDPSHTHYSASKCYSAGGNGNNDCCNWGKHFWAIYNKDHKCCDSISGVKDRGTC